MTYGLLITNQNGSIKIDDTLSRYKNVVTGTTTTNVKTTHAALPSMPMVFLRPTSYGVPFRVGTTYTDGFWVYRPTAAGSNSSFEYCVVSRFDGYVVPTSGYGLIVKNASQQLVFSSFDDCVNIDYVGQFTFQTFAQTIALPTPVFGRRFIAMIGPGVQRLVASGNFLTPYDTLIRLDSETSVTIYEAAGPAINTFAPASSYSIIGQSCTLIAGYI